MFVKEVAVQNQVGLHARPATFFIQKANEYKSSIDIDRPEDEAYKGCYFFNANSRQAPQVVDKQVQPILDQTEVYSGCYGRISVNFYGYNSNGNRGVAAGLGNIQKLKDGEALSSRTNAEDDFEAVEDEDFLG